jgi:hypothetical protein
MNILLWVLQVLAALLYGASDVMKVFMFDKISDGSRQCAIASSPGSCGESRAHRRVSLNM